MCLRPYYNLWLSFQMAFWFILTYSDTFFDRCMRPVLQSVAFVVHCGILCKAEDIPSGFVSRNESFILTQILAKDRIRFIIFTAELNNDGSYPHRKIIWIWKFFSSDLLKLRMGCHCQGRQMWKTRRSDFKTSALNHVPSSLMSWKYSNYYTRGVKK